MISGACTAIDAGIGIYFLHKANIPWPQPVTELGEKIFKLVTHQGVELGMQIVLGAISVCLFVIGLLLPDVDSPKSTLGRYFCIPIGHRTWTHTVWAIGLVSLLCMISPVFFWLALGYAIHMAWDSVSVCGVCWFYPISRYREYPSGARIKNGHKLKIYRTDSPSERNLIILILVLTAGLSGFMICHMLGI